MKRSFFCTVAGLTLLTGTALAQTATKPGAEAMQPAPAGAEGGERKLPPGGAGPGTAPSPGAKIPGAAGGAASPGLKPTPEGRPQPGQRQQGENAGVEPKPPGNAPSGAGEPRPAQAGRPEPGQKPGANQPGPGGARPAGAARAAPKLTPEQTTRVKTAFRDIHVQPVHVDFRVNVGVAVPRTVVLEPVPPEIVTYVPAYRGFRFFIVPGEIVIVDPDTFEIVDVLPL